MDEWQSVALSHFVGTRMKGAGMEACLQLESFLIPPMRWNEDAVFWL